MSDTVGNSPSDRTPIEQAGDREPASELAGPRVIEDWLRSHGISGRKAKAAASAAWRAIGKEPENDNAELVGLMEATLAKLRS